MLNGKKIHVVMPAYNAARTLEKTIGEIPREIVDDLLLVDDGSTDDTIRKAAELGIETITHDRNYGYGRNQKTCYRESLKRGADIVIMLHPDYQYSPRLITPMAGMVASGEYDVVLGSRVLGIGALKCGMPVYKYVANRFLTAFQNVMLDYKLSEYHTGYRAFDREVLETLPLEDNSDDFIFDNEMLAQAIHAGFRIGEISCPARYFREASSIGLLRSARYGLGVISVSVKFRMQRWGLGRFRTFDPTGNRLLSGETGSELE